MLPLAPALLVVLAQASPAPPAPPPPPPAPGQPPAQAGPAARAIDCAQLVGRASVWDRARAPSLGRYCDLLAQAEARLTLEPKRADEAAKAAQAAAPGQAAPLVLRARAAFALGQFGEAASLFEQARAIDARAADDPQALFALAASLRETGDKGAVAAYRALVPRVAALPSAELRARALVEAGLAILGEGPSSVDEAVAVLRVAASPDAPSTRPVALAALALALDRQGQKGEAAAAASEGQHHGALVALERPLGRGDRPIARRDDALAMVARLRESVEPGQAIAGWEAFLASAGGSPWAPHARQKLADLRKGGGGKRKGR